MECTSPLPGAHRKRIKSSKGRLNLAFFSHIQPEVVDNMPWDVNGNKIYTIPTTEEFWHDKQIDGRHWTFTTSSKKGLDGKRKFGTCQGSLICMNPQCPVFKTEKLRNQIDFVKHEFEGHACNICGYLATRIFCGCIKVTEFDRQENLLTIWHQGKHKCNLKPDIKGQREKLREESKNRPPISIQLRNTSKEFQIDLIGYYILIGDMKRAVEMAQGLADKDLIRKLRNDDGNNLLTEIQYSYGNELAQFKNLGKLKAAADKDDQYHIYKMNCRSMTGEPSYVFKTSKTAALIALKMDPKTSTGSESTMTEEEAYLDGMHSRVKGYKSLSLWTYHPGMKRVIRLATMEAEKEDTESLTMFLNLFNSVLSQVSGIVDYKFNPVKMMCDEAGANFLAIEAALGSEFIKKTVSCQWHFRQCANNQLKNVNEFERETFKDMINKLCQTSTANEYEKVSTCLQNICDRNNVSNWWNWWHARRYHIVPAYRGFNLPGLNLAEGGNSMIKTRKPMSLAVAAWRDMVMMIMQDRDYEAFINQSAKVTGRGLNLKQRQERERRNEEAFVDACVEALYDGDLDAEAMLEDDPTEFFAPNKKAKHKVPNVYNSSNPTQKRKPSVQKKKHTGKRPKIAISSDSDSDNIANMTQVPPRVEEEKLRRNPPHIVFITSMIQKCSGCEFKFTAPERRKPNDMVFKYKIFRKYPDGKGGRKTATTRSAAYFHSRDLGCLRELEELKNVQMKNLYIPNKTMEGLHKQHIKELKKRNMWDEIIRTRQNIIESHEVQVRYFKQYNPWDLHSNG